MANEKKIAKNQKHLLYQLGEALKLEEKLSQEQDSKKQAKIQKKIESSNKMILYYGKNIGQEGGTLESIWDRSVNFLTRIHGKASRKQDRCL